MNKETRKEYNKMYYENHRVEILEKLATKVICEFCNRKVSNANIDIHYTLPICTNTQKKNKFISDRQNTII